MPLRNNWRPTKRFRRIIIVRKSKLPLHWISVPRSYAHDVMLLDVRRPNFQDFFSGQVADCVIIDQTSIRDIGLVQEIIEAIGNGSKACVYLLCKSFDETEQAQQSANCYGLWFSAGDPDIHQELGIFLHPFLANAPVARP